MTDIIADIERHRVAHTARIERLVEWSDEEWPTESSLGTMWMKSPSGSVIEFYSYIDPGYCHGPMYVTEQLNLVQATIHSLAHYDRAFLKRWDDFTMHSLEIYHAVITTLLRAGFRIYLADQN